MTRVQSFSSERRKEGLSTAPQDFVGYFCHGRHDRLISLRFIPESLIGFRGLVKGFHRFIVFPHRCLFEKDRENIPGEDVEIIAFR